MVLAALGVAFQSEDKWEGRLYYAYDDFQPRKVLKVGDPIKGTLTVCTGHTDAGGGPKIIIGKKYTDEECDAYQYLDNNSAVQTLLDCTPELYYNKWAAGTAIAFVVNYGPRYCSSTMVHKFNAKDVKGGCQELLRFTYSRGKFMQGLLNRRQDDLKVCVKELEIAPGRP